MIYCTKEHTDHETSHILRNTNILAEGKSWRDLCHMWWCFALDCIRLTYSKNNSHEFCSGEIWLLEKSWMEWCKFFASRVWISTSFIIMARCLFMKQKHSDCLLESLVVSWKTLPEWFNYLCIQTQLKHSWTIRAWWSPVVRSAQSMRVGRGPIRDMVQLPGILTWSALRWPQ